MPKRNYGQAKRQREANREDKKAQKLQRKLERGDSSAENESAPDAFGSENPTSPSPDRRDSSNSPE